SLPCSSMCLWRTLLFSYTVAAPPQIYTLSLHDALPIFNQELERFSPALAGRPQIVVGNKCDLATPEQIEAFRRYIEGRGLTFVRSEEHTSELQSRFDLVCRLLLEKKKSVLTRSQE